MRADAQRNRRAILDAARELLSRYGTDVPMDAIAEAAGVGVGTIYRRFPDRLALLHAVMLDRMMFVGTLVEVAERDVDTDPRSAWDTLFAGVIDSGVTMLIPTLLPLAQQSDVFLPELVLARDAVVRRVDAVYRRAQHAGVVRADLGLPEIFLLVASAVRPLPGLPEEFQARMFVRRVALLRQLLDPQHEAIPGTPVLVPDLLTVAAPPRGTTPPARPAADARRATRTTAVTPRNGKLI